MQCLCHLCIMQLGYLPSLKTSLQMLPPSRPSPFHLNMAVQQGPPEVGLHLQHGQSASRSPLMTIMLCGKDWQHRSLSVGRGTHVSWCTLESGEYPT